MIKSALIAYLGFCLFQAGCVEGGVSGKRSQSPSNTPAAVTQPNASPDGARQDQLSGEDHWARANGLAREDPERALREYRSALDKGYDTVELRIELGGLLMNQLKRPAEAVEHLRVATGRDEKNWRAHWLLAAALLEAERFDEALSEFNISKELDPSLDGYYGYFIGRSLEGMRRYEEALANYQEFLAHEESISPSGPQVREVNERIETIRKKMAPARQ